MKKLLLFQNIHRFLPADYIATGVFLDFFILRHCLKKTPCNLKVRRKGNVKKYKIKLQPEWLPSSQQMWKPLLRMATDPGNWAASCTLEKEGPKSVTARYLQSQKQTACIPWRRNVISNQQPMLNRSQYLFSDTASRTSPSIQHAGFSWLMCSEISSRKLFPENGKVQILKYYALIFS